MINQSEDESISLMKPKKFLILVSLVSALMILPFIWSTNYHTKGEPREAVVALSMLAQDNWVSPVNNGGEIAYKPPFFHWSIAALSYLNGGEISEGISRLPSALAMVLMTVMVSWFFYKRIGAFSASCTAFIMLTNFELHRAAMNCRVDMVLTAFSVMAMLFLYSWWENDMKRIPWAGILCMSVATLTKGPVGSVLPCLVMGCFMLLKRENFWRTFFSMAAWGLLSLVIPALWYVKAYMQRGDEFISLVMEENVGRMTNTMAYDSCVNPWPYNLLTMVGGFMPWTVFLLMAAVSLIPFKRKGEDAPISKADSWKMLLSQWWNKVDQWWKNLDELDLFALVAVVVVFVFYCIPQSKRSVYLMPLYPFVAYFIGRGMIKLMLHGKKGLYRAYALLLSLLSFALFLCFVVLKLKLLKPEELFHGRHAADNIRYFNALAQIDGVLNWLLVLLPVVLAAFWWNHVRNFRSRRQDAVCKENGGYAMLHFLFVVLLTGSIYIAWDGVYQPAVLNAKSDKHMAHEIEKAVPADAPLYSFIFDTIHSKGDPIHFYITDFYLNDRIGNFYTAQPSEGYVMMKEDDVEKWKKMYGPKGYEMQLVYRGYKNCRDVGGVPMVFRFWQNAKEAH